MRKILNHLFIQKEILSGHRLIFINLDSESRIRNTDPLMTNAIVSIDSTKGVRLIGQQRSYY